MKPTYIYPGSFCPPTYGHLAVVRMAAAALPELVILCTSNTDKVHPWFTNEDCRKLWLTYALPKNVRVEVIGERRYRRSSIVMVRGIRNAADLKHETDVRELNRQEYGIEHFLYFFCDPEFRTISSSGARRAAKRLDLRELARLVSPGVVNKLLERELTSWGDLVLVVGRPGGGKSTICRALCENDPRSAHIETDVFADALKPLLREKFGHADLVKLAAERDAEVTGTIGDAWLLLLSRALRRCKGMMRIYVEAAYGLAETKRLYRFLGDKVLLVEAGNARENQRRLRARGTPEHLPFVGRIPGRRESEQIATRERLRMFILETSGRPEETRKRIEAIKTRLAKGEKLWTRSSSASCSVI